LLQATVCGGVQITGAPEGRGVGVGATVGVGQPVGIAVGCEVPVGVGDAVGVGVGLSHCLPCCTQHHCRTSGGFMGLSQLPPGAGLPVGLAEGEGVGTGCGEFVGVGVGVGWQEVLLG
jgi:hypothetical protein